MIDGENLMYGLRHLLGAEGQKAERKVLENFDFRGLIEEIMQDNSPSEILWFGARLHVYDQNDDIHTKSQSVVKQQSYFVNEIQKQKITFIKVGYLRAREVECDEGHTSWKLTEKGVDVGLAVRMMTEASEQTEIAVVSADTDLLPAFKAATKQGARVIHVSYEHRPVASLSRAASATRTITIPIARKYTRGD